MGTALWLRDTVGKRERKMRMRRWQGLQVTEGDAALDVWKYKFLTPPPLSGENMLTKFLIKSVLGSSSNFLTFDSKNGGGRLCGFHSTQHKSLETIRKLKIYRPYKVLIKRKYFTLTVNMFNVSSTEHCSGVTQLNQLAAIFHLWDFLRSKSWPGWCFPRRHCIELWETVILQETCLCGVCLRWQIWPITLRTCNL